MWVLWTLFYCLLARGEKNFSPFETVGYRQLCFAVWRRNAVSQQRDCSGSIFFKVNFFFFSRATGTHITHLLRWKIEEESWCFSWQQKPKSAVSLSPSLSLSPIYSVFLNWSTSSPLLTGAKLLKTPLLKWSTHFMFPLWTWKWGLQILCGNVLR